jgi:hypothetical protein
MIARRRLQRYGKNPKSGVFKTSADDQVGNKFKRQKTASATPAPILARQQVVMLTMTTRLAIMLLLFNKAGSQINKNASDVLLLIMRGCITTVLQLI